LNTKNIQTPARCNIIFVCSYAGRWI